MKIETLSPFKEILKEIKKWLPRVLLYDVQSNLG